MPVSSPRRRFGRRWILRSDIEDLLLIENACFYRDDCWTAQDFTSFLSSDKHSGFIYEGPEKLNSPRSIIAGFALYTMTRDSIILNSVAVHHDFRRMNLGRQILLDFAERLNPDRQSKLILYVPDTYTGAHLWLRSCGIDCIRTEKPTGSMTRDQYVFEYAPFEE